MMGGGINPPPYRFLCKRKQRRHRSGMPGLVLKNGIPSKTSSRLAAAEIGNSAGFSPMLSAEKTEDFGIAFACHDARVPTEANDNRFLVDHHSRECRVGCH